MRLGGLKTLWQRYLVWRRAEDRTMPPEPAKRINKIAADDGDIARATTANQTFEGGLS